MSNLILEGVCTLALTWLGYKTLQVLTHLIGEACLFAAGLVGQLGKRRPADEPRLQSNARPHAAQ